MKQLKFNGELYNACAPRRVNGKYTCDAWKCRTGKVVKDSRVLSALGEMLIRGRKGVV
ncbi:hypothetical protein [Desulfosporosinus youngiae]|uniref:Uncharacterized protein n=1 Tax=Desulfosporosinus youngiae DSM 17734 TaxID=768710 RepID=H5XZW5_9FIRM|nr:hypothetical protein [Desulfosporosinus youngiae]EHQ92161.1 hypothetical protein DesyoDRAFT_5230 [Desulfosporosinus youngiae DSM 17734]